MRAGHYGEATGGLIADHGSNFVSRLTPDSLRENAGFLTVEVAERDGGIIGISARVRTFSTWQGAKDSHVADLFVAAKANKMGVAQQLLLFSAIPAAAQRASVRAEADIPDDAGEAL